MIIIKLMLISFAVCFVLSALWQNWKGNKSTGEDEHEDNSI